jgi:hypothetical protein
MGGIDFRQRRCLTTHSTGAQIHSLSLTPIALCARLIRALDTLRINKITECWTTKLRKPTAVSGGRIDGRSNKRLDPSGNRLTAIEKLDAIRRYFPPGHPQR